MNGQKLQLPPEELEKVRQAQEETLVGTKNADLAANLERAMADAEAKNVRESLGLDLTFDPKTFITTGTVLRKGLKIMDGVYVDMKSLSTKERMVAEGLVWDKFGVMRSDGVYFHAIEAAILAVSILRINREEFPIPLIGGPDKDNANFLERKRSLFETLLDASSELVDGISLVYKNLKLIEVPNEETQKKS